MEKFSSIKAFSIALITTALILVLVTLVFPDSAIKLIVNGKEVRSDYPLQKMDGHIMVPINVVSDALGAKVAWDSSNNAVVIDTAPSIPNNTAKNSTSTVKPEKLTAIGYDNVSPKGDIRLNQWLDGTSFKLNGVNYNNGIAFNTDSKEAYVTYNIGAKYSVLTGLFGTGEDGVSQSVTELKIYGDDKLLYLSPKLTPDSQSVPVEVNVSGVNILKVYFDTTNGGNPIFANPVLK